ncbi:hypothetical protein AHF37_04045 [Paragonimus kellicotti]|nr:hypothetical protein AHF37_04045 [Paragonimus kellicotti]
MHKFGFTPIDTAAPNDEDVQRRSSVFGGKRSLADWIKIHFDRSVLVFQLFYFFFYAAFGSLFPLISIYFKQLGLSAVQCGVLGGIRYLVDWLATPFWNALAEKWKKGKSFLIVSLVCSMSFTLGLGFVRPSPEGCLVRLPYSLDYNESLDNVFGAPLAIVEPYRFSTYENLKSVEMTRDLALNIKNRIGQSPLYLDIKQLVDNPKPKEEPILHTVVSFFYTAAPNDEDVQRRSSVFGGKRSLADWIKIHFDRSVLVFQLFYFFFYAAFGSLFPLISIYFKQLGLSAVQCGVLGGIRYLVDWLATPFWNALAEKWKKGKSFLIVSLVCSMSFTLGLGFVRPSPEGCLVRLPYSLDYNESLDNVFGAPLAIVEPYRFSTYENLKSVEMTRDLALNIKNRIGQSPLYLDIKQLVDNPKPKPKGYGRVTEQKLYSKVPNFRNPTHYASGSLVMPLYSTVVYSQTKINQIFIIIILLLLFGELLSCPAIPLVDALVALKTSVQPTSLYGQQRMMGSVGWGLAMFFIGLALDNSSVFQDYPCLQPGYRERNYMVCFATYSVFMAFALFTSTQFSFTYEGGQESMYFKLVKDKMAKTLLGRTTKNRSKLVNEEDPDEDDLNVTEHNTTGISKPEQNKTIPTNEEILERQLGIKLGANEKKLESKKPETADSSVDSGQESFVATAHLKITKWAKAMRYFAKPQLLLFLFVTWFMGMGVGQVFTFLFWHMQELNGSPTLFGVATSYLFKQHTASITICPINVEVPPCFAPMVQHRP